MKLEDVEKHKKLDALQAQDAGGDEKGEEGEAEGLEGGSKPKPQDDHMSSKKVHEPIDDQVHSCCPRLELSGFRGAVTVMDKLQAYVPEIWLWSCKNLLAFHSTALPHAFYFLCRDSSRFSRESTSLMMMMTRRRRRRRRSRKSPNQSRYTNRKCTPVPDSVTNTCLRVPTRPLSTSMSTAHVCL